MPQYLFVYRSPRDYAPSAESGRKWHEWFEAIGASVTELGEPVFTHEVAGDCRPGTELGGYSVVSADSLEEAASLAGGCPLVVEGIGGVEIGELTPISTFD